MIPLELEQLWYKMFDVYSLKARLWPALIACMPAAAIVTILIPNVEWWHAGLLGSGAGAAMTFLLAQMARSAGKRREPQLWKSWGGSATTRYLRHRKSPLDPHTLARRRSIYSQIPEPLWISFVQIETSMRPRTITINAW